MVGLGFQPSGSRLFAALEDRHIALLDLISSQMVRETRTERRIPALDVSSDGRLLVWGGEDGRVEVLTEDFQTQQSLRAPSLYRKSVRFFAFGLEDREIAGAAEEGNVAYWALGTTDPVRTEALTRQEVVALARDTSGTVLAMGIKALGVVRAQTMNAGGSLVARATHTIRILAWERGRTVRDIEAVLDELRFRNTGVTSAQDAAQIGQMLNAGVVLLGSLNQLGTTTVISVRLVETESARIMGARELVCNSCQLEDLPAAVGVLAESLVEG